MPYKGHDCAEGAPACTDQQRVTGGTVLTGAGRCRYSKFRRAQLWGIVMGVGGLWMLLKELKASRTWAD